MIDLAILGNELVNLAFNRQSYVYWPLNRGGESILYLKFVFSDQHLSRSLLNKVIHSLCVCTATMSIHASGKGNSVEVVLTSAAE